MAATSPPQDDPGPSAAAAAGIPGTPSILELETALESSRAPLNHVDEVWPNLYIGDLLVAHDKKWLRRLGITHVLNAAHNNSGTKGDSIFYGRRFRYHGIAADDCPLFDLSRYFYPAAELIEETLRGPDARVLVHCILGMSRSAALVLAYLMIYGQRSLLHAIHRVILYRPISPNRGFLQQLRNLDMELSAKKLQRLRGELQDPVTVERKPSPAGRCPGQQRPCSDHRHDNATAPLVGSFYCGLSCI